MSSLVGSPHDRVSLARAVDQLLDAARRAGRPGWIWLAGVLYPSLNLNVDLVRSMLGLVQRTSGIDMPGAGEVGLIMTLFAPGAGHVTLGGPLGASVTLVPLLLVFYRLIVGLARVSDPLEASPESPAGSPLRATRLRRVWSEGKGLAATGFGLWAMLLLLLLGAMLVLIGPVVALAKMLGLASFSPLIAALLVPFLILILAYAAVLMVVNQLALHSLAHNRRGVASALTHAWRLIRAAPMGALRAALVDFVLFLTVALVSAVLVGVLKGGLGSLAEVLSLALYGFAGVTRAGFWARTYRALGGLSAADGVPGL